MTVVACGNASGQFILPILMLIFDAINEVVSYV